MFLLLHFLPQPKQQGCEARNWNFSCERLFLPSPTFSITFFILWRSEEKPSTQPSKENRSLPSIQCAHVLPVLSSSHDILSRRSSRNIFSHLLFREFQIGFRPLMFDQSWFVPMNWNLIKLKASRTNTNDRNRASFGINDLYRRFPNSISFQMATRFAMTFVTKPVASLKLWIMFSDIFFPRFSSVCQ